MADQLLSGSSDHAYAPEDLERCCRTTSTVTTASKVPRLSAIEYVYLEFVTEVAKEPVFHCGARPEYPPCPDTSTCDDPFTWSKTRKNLMTWVSCATNITAAYSAGSYAAPTYQTTKLWGISELAYKVGITMFTLGFGLAPMVLAPFSEVQGRRPVFIATGILFVMCQLGCALTNSFAGMLIIRFLAGVGGSTFSTMVGGILADIWCTSERNGPMVLFTGATLFGTGLGPLVSGFVAQHLSWRWVFYIQVVTSGLLIGLVTIFFKETRGPILLSRKAKLVNQWYEELENLGAMGIRVMDEKDGNSDWTTKRIRYCVLAEEQRLSLWKMISVSLTRPAKLLFTEPIIICFSLWVSFSWGILYLQFGAIPIVFETVYGFTLEQTGAVFTAICTGASLSTILSIYQDKWAVQKFGPRFTMNPEGRLWFTCAEGSLMPIGMFIFGWTCHESIHWIVPTIALVAITMGIFSIFLASFNYIADVYQLYASSALAASSLCRNLLGGGLQLATVPMYQSLGFQAASSLLGGIGLLLAIGPILLIWYGPQIRARSGVAKQFIDKSEV